MKQSVFGKPEISVAVTVTDPDGTVTHFTAEEAKQDMGTPESRRALAEKRASEKQESK